MPLPSARTTLKAARIATIALGVLMSTAVPRRATGQSPAASAFTGEWALQQQARQRWLHGHQPPRFTQFLDASGWIMVDSIRHDGATSRLWLTLGRSAYGHDSALIAVAPTGQVALLDIGLAPYPPRANPFADSARYADMKRRGPGNKGVALPEVRVWDVVPPPPPESPRVGLSWKDTIARVASDGLFRQAMHGTRISRIVAERVIDGRQLWLVRDSASVTYEEQYPEHARTLDTTLVVSRRAAGTIVGTHLYDPSLPLTRQRDDTTWLAGDATLRYPDGRTFRTPARFERTRHWTLLDAPAYAAHIAELRAARGRASGGMVFVPDSRLDHRLASGDVKARDSLLDAWKHTSDPDSTAFIFQRLQQWATRTPGSRALIERTRVAAGDSAFLYTRLAENVQGEEPLDAAYIRAMLPFMENPGRAWSFNLSDDWMYENLVQALAEWPPAAAAYHDWPYRHVACTPAACRLLADQWHSAREPRLRDVGLVAQLILDPARWADTVLALDGPRHPLLHPAALLVRGVAATWDAGSKAPMPPPNSDWHAWLEWMDGRDPRWVASTRQTTLPARFKRDTLPQVRFEESHVAAIRFYQARTGRDIVAELRHGFESASSDSARYVFGAMLERLGALEANEAQVYQGFRSGNPAQVALAQQMLSAGFEKAVPADTSVAIPLLERLLAAIVDSAPLWPKLGADSVNRRSDPATLHMPRGTFFLDTAGLPPRIRAEWGTKVRIMPASAWNSRDVREGGLFYTISPITIWGHFARIEVNATERNPRKPDEVPRANASGTTYWLMNVDGQWVIVDEDGWVT